MKKKIGAIEYAISILNQINVQDVNLIIWSSANYSHKYDVSVILRIHALSEKEISVEVRCHAENIDPRNWSRVEVSFYTISGGEFFGSIRLEDIGLFDTGYAVKNISSLKDFYLSARLLD